MSYNCLSTLDGLDKFTELQELILDNNCLEDGVVFPVNEKLTGLSINKNKVTG